MMVSGMTSGTWQIWPVTNLSAPACPLAGALPRQPSQARADWKHRSSCTPLGQIVGDLTNETDGPCTAWPIRRFQRERCPT
jgi:hypothetical protein